jgi:hypothetical protein
MIALTRNGPTPAPQCGPVETLVSAVSSYNAADRARDGSVEARLDNGQKTALVILAKQAWERVRLVDDTVTDFNSWRQEQAMEAVKCRISEARVGNFSALKRHFLNLAGKAGAAFNSAMRESTEAERIAFATLQRECAERELPLDYPAAIARKQFKGAALKDLNAKQLWCLVFTVRNRRKPALKPGDAETRRKGDGEKQRTRNYTLKRESQAVKLAPAPQPDHEEDDPF